MADILIIADREGESQTALHRGMGLAEKMGCGVEVVAFCYESLRALGVTQYSRQARMRKRLVAHRKREVAAKVKAAKLPGVPVTLTVVWEKHIHNWLIKKCGRKHSNYAAVVKTGHRSESFLYTPTDWRLLRGCPAPVLICAEKKWRRTVPVAAAVDLGSERRFKQQLNRQVITTAKHYAETMQCELYLIYAIRISPVLKELDLVDQHEYARKAKKALGPRVEELSQEYDIPANRFLLKQGPADKVINSEAARLKAQLLVMGTGGRSGVRAALMGNTAESVLLRLRTDVLALKT